MHCCIHFVIQPHTQSQFNYFFSVIWDNSIIVNQKIQIASFNAALLLNVAISDSK